MSWSREARTLQALGLLRFGHEAVWLLGMLRQRIGPDIAPVSRTMALKVPEVTVYFWIVKLLTTAMGESTTDYLVFQIDPYVAVAAGFVGLALALVLQLLVRRYVAWIYWLAVVMVAVFGTMAADVLHVVLGIPYLVLPGLAYWRT